MPHTTQPAFEAIASETLVHVHGGCGKQKSGCGGGGRRPRFQFNQFNQNNYNIMPQPQPQAAAPAGPCAPAAMEPQPMGSSMYEVSNQVSYNGQTQTQTSQA